MRHVFFFLIAALLFFVGACKKSSEPTGPSYPEVAYVSVSAVGGTVLSIGDSVQLVAIAYGTSGDTLRNVPFIWSSSDTNVVRVNQNGVAHGIGVGRSTVRATAPNGQYGELQITVKLRVTVIAQNLKRPWGLAMDEQGNLYVSNYGDGSIVKISPSGQTSVIAWPGLNCQGLAYKSGWLYVAMNSSAMIKRVNVATGAVEVFAENAGLDLNQPDGVAFGPDGSLYVTNAYGRISKIDAQGHVTPYAVVGNQSLYGIAVDQSGNVYVGAPLGLGFGVVEVSAGTLQQTTLFSTAGLAEGLAISSSGDLYVADGPALPPYDWGRILKYNLSTGALVELVNSGEMKAPSGVAIGANVIYVTSTWNNTVLAVHGK